MKKGLKRIFCAVMGIVLLFAFAACKDDAKNGSSAQQMPDTENNDTEQLKTQTIPSSSPFADKIYSVWLQLDGLDTMPKQLDFDNMRVNIDERSHPWAIGSISDIELTLELVGLYRFTVTFRGEYLFGTLLDTATQQSASYYSRACGYDTSWKEYIYPKAVSYVDACLAAEAEGAEPSLEWETDAEPVTLTGNAAWKKLYETFELLGDYRDSEQYLGRFTVLEDMYTGAEMFRSREDRQQNYFTETVTYYPNGQVYSRNGYDEDYRLYTGYGDETKYFEYDQNGKLTRVLEKEGKEITSQIVIKYDQNGSVTDTKYQTQYISRDIFFKCNQDGLLTENTSFYASNNYRYTYTYDDQGRLTQIVRVYDGYSSGPATTYTFEYDENGFLAKYTQQTLDERQSSSGYTFCELWVYEYQNDSLGRALSADVTWVYGQKGDEPYWPDMKVLYYYEDLYFFE